MATHLETRLEIKSWSEEPYRQLPDGRKLTRADVSLTVAEQNMTAEAGWEALMYYAVDGTSNYVGLMHVVGRLGTHSGGFVLQGAGTFDGTHASSEFFVIPGSGTGDLTDLRGTGASVSTHDDYPFMPLTLDYEV